MPDVLELDIANVTYSAYDVDGYLTVQHDAYGVEEDASTATSPYWSHHPLGFISRPLDPILQNGQVDPKQSGIVLVAMEGGVGHSIPLEDTRVMPLLPSLKKGESMMYGPVWGQFIRCREDGSIVISTTTKPVTDGTGQQVTLTLSASDGSFQFVSPAGRLVFGPSGFHVQHTSGASIDLGALGGLPAPLDQISSHFSVQAGTTSLDSSIVAAGPSSGVSGGPPALATPLLVYLTALQAAVAAIAAAIPGPGAAAAVTAAGTAATALSAAAELIPSQAVAA